MSHRRTTRSVALTGVALLLAACGSAAPVELDVAPAATVDDAADAAEELLEADTAGTAEPDDVVAEPEPTPDVADPAPTDPAPTEAPAEPDAPQDDGSSAEPPPADPELVVGEDGCVTDVATGLVVTCYDPAAGPDED